MLKFLKSVLCLQYSDNTAYNYLNLLLIQLLFPYIYISIFLPMKQFLVTNICRLGSHIGCSFRNYFYIMKDYNVYVWTQYSQYINLK